MRETTQLPETPNLNFVKDLFYLISSNFIDTQLPRTEIFTTTEIDCRNVKFITRN